MVLDKVEVDRFDEMKSFKRGSLEVVTSGIFF